MFQSLVQKEFRSINQKMQVTANLSKRRSLKGLTDNRDIVIRCAGKGDSMAIQNRTV